ncbi:hypothetical protein MKW92_020254 [Papaver armeniacum]|nr:hypothetical protein MKW92_020254 [Papaver armeniacum]
MTKHRAKDVPCNDSSADDDFVKPKKKNKIVDSSKDGDKGGPSKDTKSANFGPLHDLFRDLENKGLMAREN